MNFLRVGPYLLNPANIIAVEIGISASRGYAEGTYSLVYSYGQIIGINYPETQQLLLRLHLQSSDNQPTT